VFLKRQMVLKQDGSGLPMLPTNFRIGLDVGILGRSIRIYDCDQYTREFFQVRIPISISNSMDFFTNMADDI